MPVEAGIQLFPTRLDSRFRGNDESILGNIYYCLGLFSFLQPGCREKPFFTRFLAIPEPRPQAFAAVVILGHAASEADSFHQALAADSLKSMGETFPQILENGILLPDFLQAVARSVAEHEFGHGFPDAAQGVRPIRQNAQNPQDPADGTSVSLLSEHSSQRPESCGMAEKDRQFCRGG